MNRESKRNINDSSDKGYNLNKQMKIQDLKKWSDDINPDWPKDEVRIDDIGLNHVDGKIYEKLSKYK